MLEICGNLAHLYIYQNVREQNETLFLILGRKIVAWKPRSSQATHQLAVTFFPNLRIWDHATAPFFLRESITFFPGLLENNPVGFPERSVTSRYHGTMISTIFLDRDGHLDCRTTKQTYGLPFCSWAQPCKGKTYILAAIIVGARFVEIQKLFYRSNVT